MSLASFDWILFLVSVASGVFVEEPKCVVGRTKNFGGVRTKAGW